MQTAARLPSRRWRRVAEWTRRYLPAELAGTTAAITAAAVALGGGAARSGAVLAATWAETIGFYGFVSGRELRWHARRGERRRVVRVARAVRGVVAEFGVAEAVDTLVLRPGLMYAGALLLDGVLLGVLAGKLAADVLFYALAIPAYEWRKRRDPALALSMEQ